MFKKRFVRNLFRVLLAVFLLFGVAVYALYSMGILTTNPHLEKVVYLQQECLAYLQGDVEIALPNHLTARLEDAIDELEHLENECSNLPSYYTILADCYVLMANDLATKQYLREAIDYYLRALNYVRQAPKSSFTKEKSIANIYNLLHLVYQTDGDLLKAETFCRKSVEQFEIIEDQRWVGMSKMNLSRICYWLGKYEESLIYAAAGREAYLVSNDMVHADSTFVVVSWCNSAVSSISLAKQAKEKGKESLEQQYLRDANTAIDEVFARKGWFINQEKHYQWPSIMQVLLSTSFDKIQPEAQYRVSEMIAEMEQGFSKVDRTDRDQLLALQGLLKAEFLLQHDSIAEAKQLIIESWGRVEHEVKEDWTISAENKLFGFSANYHSSYLRCLEKLIAAEEPEALFKAQLSLVKLLHLPQHKEKEDFRTLAASNVVDNIYQRCLQTAFRLWPSQPTVIEDIDYLLDNQRARLLRYTIHSHSLEDQAEGELKEWLQKDYTFQEQLLQLQAQMNREKETGTIDSIHLRMNNVLAEREAFYKSTVAKEGLALLELSRPDVPQINDIQQLMSDKEALVQFVNNGDKLMIITMTDDDVYVTASAPYNQWSDALKTCQQVFIGEQDDDDKDFISAGYTLYQNCLEEALEKLPARVDELTFIMDAPLENINVGALVRSLAGKEPFADRDYLLKAYKIKYDYLLSSFAANLRMETVKKAVPLVCSPDYDMNETDTICKASSSIANLQNLAIERASNSGVVLVEGTKSELGACVEGVNSLFIAAHGRADWQDPLLSYLLLLPTNGEDCRLHFGELICWNLDRADVVLGSCETEIGPDISGNGITSLAQAFTIAGARSLVANVGNVKDEMTAVLLDYYFDYLDQGYDKSEALQKAQMDYLDTAPDRLTAPYCWAKTILIGHGGPTYPQAVQ